MFTYLLVGAIVVGMIIAAITVRRFPRIEAWTDRNLLWLAIGALAFTILFVLAHRI